MTQDSHQWIDDAMEYYWDDTEQKILMIEFHKTHTWEQYYALMEGVYDFIDGRVDEVAYINLHHQGIYIPDGSPVPHLQNMLARFKSPFIVAIDKSRNPFVMRFMSMIAKLLRYEEHQASDVESARKIIAKHFEQANSTF